VTRTIAHLLPRSLILTVLATILVFAPSATAVAASEDVTDLHERIETLVSAHIGETTPGATVAVVDQEGELLLEAWGQADPTAQTPMTVETRTPVASVSKVVTSLTALSLHQEGLLDLDADIRQDLPVEDQRAEEARTPVTGRHLLTHHSGLAESMFFHPDPPDMYETAPLTSVLEQHPPVLRHPTDIGMHYSALQGHTLLGAAIEQASGSSFDEAARRWVLDPIGAATADFHGPGQAPGDAVISTRSGDDWVPAGWPPVHERPAAALTWSTRDAAALLEALINGEGLPEEVIAEATTPAVRPLHGGPGHTQAFFESWRADVPMLEHAGANGLAYLALIPDAGLGIFAAVTTEDEVAASFTTDVLDTVAQWAVDTGRTQPDPIPAAGLPAIVPPWANTMVEPVAPVGTFQQRLFHDRGPERALRSLLTQVTVTRSGSDLQMGERVLSSTEAPGRWCDDQGCVAGVRTPDGTTTLQLGHRQMLEQTLVPAPWWADQRFVLAAIGGALLLTVVSIAGSIRSRRNRRRDRAVATAVSRPLSLIWGLLAVGLTVATPAVVLVPFLSGSSEWLPAEGTGVWTLRILTGVHTLVGLAWLVRAGMRWRQVSGARRVLLVPAALVGLAATVVLASWVLPPL